ncbi:hypothetical protein F444_08984, partial [Phytophthora nicotianae P1976]
FYWGLDTFNHFTGSAMAVFEVLISAGSSRFSVTLVYLWGDFFGATTDGGSDVHHMMTSSLQLSLEWCMPHLTNAATKAAFGMTSNIARSKNPEMLQLLKKVTRTIYQVRSVEVMGDSYEQLVRLLGVGKENKLIDYKLHRFMSLTRVFQRIVKHWKCFLVIR